MKKVIMTLGLLVTTLFSYSQIDSAEVYTPSRKKVETLLPGTKKDLGKVLDSLNNIYRTDKFYLLLHSKDGVEVREFSRVKVVKQEDTI